MLRAGSDAYKIRQSPGKYLYKWDDISGVSLSTDVAEEFIILVETEETNVSFT